ncbi:MAG: hypothetical protein AAF628_12170 [Planctomycetota bacterium]
MEQALPHLIFAAGIGQLSVLIASALVPFALDWKKELGGLSRLHRQLYWIYGGYVVMAIVAFGVLSVRFAAELAGGEALARGLCAYIAVFWGVRLALQAVLDVEEHLSSAWRRAGYHLLTVAFVIFTTIYGYGALH